MLVGNVLYCRLHSLVYFACETSLRVTPVGTSQSQKVVSCCCVHLLMMNTTHMHTSRPWESTKTCSSSEGIRCCTLTSAWSHLSGGTALLYGDGLESLSSFQPLWYLLVVKVGVVEGWGGRRLHVKDRKNIAEVREKERAEETRWM